MLVIAAVSVSASGKKVVIQPSLTVFFGFPTQTSFDKKKKKNARLCAFENESISLCRLCSRSKIIKFNIFIKISYLFPTSAATNPSLLFIITCTDFLWNRDVKVWQTITYKMICLYPCIQQGTIRQLPCYFSSGGN